MVEARWPVNKPYKRPTNANSFIIPELRRATFTVTKGVRDSPFNIVGVFTPNPETSRSKTAHIVFIPSKNCNGVVATHDMRRGDMVDAYGGYVILIDPVFHDDKARLYSFKMERELIINNVRFEGQYCMDPGVPMAGNGGTVDDTLPAAFKDNLAVRVNEPGRNEEINCAFEHSWFHFPGGKINVPILVVTRDVQAGQELLTSYGNTARDYETSLKDSIETKAVFNEPKLVRDVVRIQRLHMTEVTQEVVELKQEVVELKQEVVELKQEVVEFNEEVVELKQEVVELKQEVVKLTCKRKRDRIVLASKSTEIAKLRADLTAANAKDSSLAFAEVTAELTATKAKSLAELTAATLAFNEVAAELTATTAKCTMVTAELTVMKTKFKSACKWVKQLGEHLENAK